MAIAPPPARPLSFKELFTLDVGEGFYPRDLQRLLGEDPDDLTDAGRDVARRAAEAGWS